METSIFIGNRQEYFKYELLSLSGGEYKHNSYITDSVESCNIKTDFTRDIITTASFTLKYNDNINYLSDLIKPWYCIVIDGTEYEFPLGAFMLTVPKADYNGNVIETKIDGNDLLLALDQDRLTYSYSVSAGTNVIDAVKTLLDGAGTWVNYNIEDNDETLLEDMSYELGRSRLFLINSLLNTINYYPLWANGNGVFKAAPWSEYKNTTWNFYDDSNSLYTSDLTYDLDFSEIYNRVVIVAKQTTADAEPLISILTFEDIDMDDYLLSYTSLGRYITKVFDSEAVSQSYVDLRARRELLKMTEFQESISYKHAFITSRENDGLPNQGDCFNFKNTSMDIDATYLIESQSYDLKVGGLVNTMIRRIISV